MKKVKDILNEKGEIYSISKDASVLEAIKSMAEKGIGALLVLENEKLIGIITERDYAKKIILAGKSEKTKVSEIMTKDVLYVELDETVEECMALIIDKKIRHLPVISKDKLVGILSIRDLVKSMIENQKFIISQLEHYIHS